MRPLATAYKEVTTDSQPLDSKVCDFVVLTATPILLDGTRIAPDANGNYNLDGNEILWGIAGSEAAHTLYIGETSQPIPVENANQIIVKVANLTAGQLVIYSTFKEQKEQLI